MSFRHTVIPVAGLGTRFLPATKATPKELLPIVDRPLLQYAVDEAVVAGGDRIVLVSSPDKGAVEHYFRSDARLRQLLSERGETELLRALRQTELAGSIQTVLQERPLGVGHAVLQARPVIGEESFAVMFPDDFVIAETPVMQQLRRVHERHGGIVLAVQRVPMDQVHRYGVIAGQEIEEGLYRVTDMVEKPEASEAPTDLAVIGRYVLPWEIFEILAATEAGVGGEIQLTDAMRSALPTQPCHALVFEGRRFDCGSKLGFLAATVAVALRHPELGPAFRALLEGERDADS